jgi:4-amino-4-deoxy-L-arabinose transferase-like glycosyltransferase
MKELKGAWTIALCAALLVVHVILARTAVVQKNAVYDEPLHTAAGRLVKHDGDYRIDAEDPALFLEYAALPLARGDMDFSSHADLRQQVANDHKMQWPLVTASLYRTPGVDGEALIQRSRLMFLPITFLLGASIASLAYKLGGSWAAIIAATLYAFDPNFLGHGAIVKNDVMLSLFMMLFTINLWKIGERVTPWNAVSIGLVIGGALCVKFSGMLFVPMLILAMLIRVIQKSPWRWMSREATNWPSRAGVALTVCCIAAAVSFVTIWTIYRFRFLPSNESQPFDMSQLVWLAKQNGKLAEIADPHAPPPTEAEIAEFKSPLLVKGIVFANDHRLLPQAWLAGLLYTHATTQIRATFLLGQYSYIGWWYFFPVAMLVKTPTASLVAFIATVSLIARKQGAQLSSWTKWSLAIAPAIYFAVAILSNLNLGLRHILPVYPVIFVLIAVTLAKWLSEKPGRIATMVLGAGLLLECLVTYPNFIAFFNLPSDKLFGRINLLSDSSFDWGQDIKTLRKWQDAHPDVHIYLAGFGMVNADVYGLRRTDLYDNRGFTNPQPLGREPGVVAISATVLQGTYLSEEWRQIYRKFLQLKPREVLGDTIYLYDWPPRPKNAS